MKQVLIGMCLATVLCAAGGCNGNKRSPDYSAEREAEAEVEVESRRSAWSYLAFWNWFGGDDAPAVAAAPGEKVEIEIDDDEMEMEVEREPFTYTRQVRAKPWTDYVLPWRWFAEEEVVTEVDEFDEFEEIEVEIEKEDDPHPLAFWRWFDDDDDDDEITEDDVLDDMSPELVTRAETKGETKIRRAKVLDVNGRTIWDDLNEIFFFDRPSRLSLYPTP